MNTGQILDQLEKQRDALTAALSILARGQRDGRKRLFRRKSSAARPRRRLSAAAKRRLSEAARARWAAAKKAGRNAL
jgi:hypothetical protein